jgi:hypothetical protein
LSLLLTVGLAFDVSPWLRGDTDWRWTYNPPESLPIWLAVAGLALAGYIAASAILWRWAGQGSGGRRSRWVLAFAVVMGLVLQIVIITISDSDPLAQLLFRTTFPFNGGFYTVSTYSSNSISAFLTHFPQTAPNYVPHPQRHPPGLDVLFISLLDMFKQLPALAAQIAAPLHPYRCDFLPFVDPTNAEYAAAAGGLLAPVMTALGIIPLYLAARDLFDEQAALGIALISPLAPAYSLWAGVWDQAFVMVTGLLLWLLILGLVKRRFWALWLAGGLLSVMTFFTHAMLVLVAFASCCIALSMWQARESWRADRGRWIAGVVGFVLALPMVWVAYWLLFGVTFLDVYRANTQPHFQMLTHYTVRLFYNPYDFALFLGFPLGFVALVAVWQIARDSAAGKSLRPEHGVVMAFGLTFGALVISGIARAEVGRVWIFLMPLAILAAFAAQNGPAKATRLWLTLAGLLALQTLVMQTTLELNTPRGALRVANPLPEVIPVNVQANQQLKLLAFSLEHDTLRPGDTYTSRMYWQSVGTSPVQYQALIYAFSEDANNSAGRTGYLLDARRVSTCSPVSSVYGDQLAPRLPGSMPPGRYRIYAFVRRPSAELGAAQPQNSWQAIFLTLITVLPR